MLSSSRLNNEVSFEVQRSDTVIHFSSWNMQMRPERSVF